MPLCVASFILTWSLIDGGSWQRHVNVGDLPGVEHRGSQGIFPVHAKTNCTVAPRVARQGLLGGSIPEPMAADRWHQLAELTQDPPLSGVLALGRRQHGDRGQIWIWI